MSKNVACPICRGAAGAGQWADRGEWFECARCGKYLMTFDLSDDLRMMDPKPPWWFRLSAWVRERCDLGERYFDISGNLAEVEASLPTRTFTEQLDLLLRLIERETVSLGQVARLDLDKTAPLVWARDGGEVVALLSHLRDLERVEPEQPGGQMVRGAVRLSTKGLLRLEELSGSTALNDRIFVAMWFPPKGNDEHEHMRGAYRDGILKAIEAAGYKPFRVDEEPITDDRIDARIMVNIRRSRALIADLTGHRPNVTFEAGFAAALGRPVLWSVRKDWFEKGLPFDVRQFPFLVWDSPAQIVKELVPRIQDRLGIRSGPGARGAGQ
ncbi:MAG: hypothetical protein WAT39_13005 [Planctomycetota bacterium]